MDGTVIFGGRQLPGVWTAVDGGRIACRYRHGGNPGELLRLMVGKSRGQWFWKVDWRNELSVDWEVMGGSSAGFDSIRTAQEQADKAVAGIDGDF